MISWEHENGNMISFNSIEIAQFPFCMIVAFFDGNIDQPSHNKNVQAIPSIIMYTLSDLVVIYVMVHISTLLKQNWQKRKQHKWSNSLCFQYCHLNVMACSIIKVTHQDKPFCCKSKKLLWKTHKTFQEQIHN